MDVNTASQSTTDEQMMDILLVVARKFVRHFFR